MCAVRNNGNTDDPTQPLDSDDEAVEFELDFRPSTVVIPREGASERELREVLSVFRSLYGLIMSFRL